MPSGRTPASAATGSAQAPAALTSIAQSSLAAVGQRQPPALPFALAAASRPGTTAGPVRARAAAR